MGIDNRALRDAYENAHSPLKEAVDAAYSAMADYLTDNTDFTVSNCDRAENLVTEIYLFVCESNDIPPLG